MKALNNIVLQGFPDVVVAKRPLDRLTGRLAPYIFVDFKARRTTCTCNCVYNRCRTRPWRSARSTRCRARTCPTRTPFARASQGLLAAHLIAGQAIQAELVVRQRHRPVCPVGCLMHE